MPLIMQPAHAARQDVGLNGLSTEDERTFSTYQKYLERRTRQRGCRKLTRSSTMTRPATIITISGASDYDREERSILERYKYYNNTEGNSTASEDSPERYDISSKTVPDVEDINQDNTLNETEKYFQYRVRLDSYRSESRAKLYHRQKNSQRPPAQRTNGRSDLVSVQSTRTQWRGSGKH